MLLHDQHLGNHAGVRQFLHGLQMRTRINYAGYDQLVEELTRIDRLDRRYYLKGSHDHTESLAYYQRLERRRAIMERLVTIQRQPATEGKVH